MALAISGTGPAIKTSAGSTGVVTSDSFTPPAGSRLWAFATFDAASGSFVQMQFSSSPGLTWVPVFDATGTAAFAHCAYADVVTSQAYTVTATMTGTNTFSGASLHVVVITGGETTPLINASTTKTAANGGTSWLPNVAIVPTATESMILAAAAGFSGTTAWTVGSTPDSSPGPYAQTLLAGWSDAGLYQGAYWKITPTTLTGKTYTPKVSGSNEQGNIGVVEIRSGTTKTIGFRGDAGLSTGTSSVVTTVPSNAVAGDVLLYHVVTNSGATPSAPAGWELLQRQVNGTTVGGHVFAKVSDGTEHGTNVTVSGLATHSAGYIQAFSNCNVNVPTIAAGASWMGPKSSRANASGTKGSTAVLPDSDNSMIILADYVAIGTTHNTWLDGNSNAMTETTSDGGDGTVSMSSAYLRQTSRISTGVGTWSQPNNGAGVGMWITLIPDTAAAPSNPTVTVELWENGSFKSSLGSSVVSADGVLSYTWDAATLTAISGANVELRISSDLDMDIGAVEWNAYRTAITIPVSTSPESWGLMFI